MQDRTNKAYQPDEIGDLDVIRALGAAERLRTSDATDRFFHQCDGMISKYAIEARTPPDKTARDLVSSGLVAPDNPAVVALAEAEERSDPRDLSAELAEMAPQARSRSTAIQIAALGRAVRSGQGGEGVAESLERISVSAWAAGDEQVAGKAARSMAWSVQQQRESRSRDRWRDQGRQSELTV